MTVNEVQQYIEEFIPESEEKKKVLTQKSLSNLTTTSELCDPGQKKKSFIRNLITE